MGDANNQLPFNAGLSASLRSSAILAFTLALMSIAVAFAILSAIVPRGPAVASQGRRLINYVESQRAFEPISDHPLNILASRTFCRLGSPADGRFYQ